MTVQYEIIDAKLAKSNMIMLEGPDGVGKSSVAAELTRIITSRGYPVVSLQLPSKKLKQQIIKSHWSNPLAVQALIRAEEAEAYTSVVLPALKRGDYVVADRCFLSGFAYLGASECTADLQAAHMGLVSSMRVFGTVVVLQASDGILNSRLSERSIEPSDYYSERMYYSRAFYSNNMEEGTHEKGMSEVMNHLCSDNSALDFFTLDTEKFLTVGELSAYLFGIVQGLSLAAQDEGNVMVFSKEEA